MAVARRLTELLRPGDTFARLAGDEFVILCEDLDRHVAGRAPRHQDRRGTGRRRSSSRASRSRSSASVGIAFAGRGDDVPEQILQDADTAMYQAKRKGGARHGVVDVGEQRLADNRATLNRDLRGALARRELRTEYQPIVATSDGRITGVEALLRWAHPIRGIVAPDTVVPLAEQSGLHHRHRPVGADAGVCGPAPVAAPRPAPMSSRSASTSRPRSSWRRTSRARLPTCWPRRERTRMW